MCIRDRRKSDAFLRPAPGRRGVLGAAGRPGGNPPRGHVIPPFAAGPGRGPYPVSYTHLDVYKRQRQIRNLVDGILELNTLHRQPIELIPAIMKQRGIIFEAVSYTHLDVYKRQIVGSSQKIQGYHRGK